MRDEDREDELIKAFKVLDPEGTGTIPASQMRQVLTSFGEKLSDEEAEELIKDADPEGSGQISYEGK